LLSRFLPFLPRGGRTFSSRESPPLRVKKMVLFLVLRANSGSNPNSPRLDPNSCGVLDGCSRTRNQAPYENLPII